MIYQDAGAFVAGPAALTPVASTGNPPIEPGTSFYIRGYSRGAQTAWLRRTLDEARKDDSIDWIIGQMHQDATTSSETGNGSDAGLRETWLPLFDEYQVDLVLCATTTTTSGRSRSAVTTAWPAPRSRPGTAGARRTGRTR